MVFDGGEVSLWVARMSARDRREVGCGYQYGYQRIKVVEPRSRSIAIRKETSLELRMFTYLESASSVSWWPDKVPIGFIGSLPLLPPPSVDRARLLRPCAVLLRKAEVTVLRGERERLDDGSGARCDASGLLPITEFPRPCRNTPGSSLLVKLGPQSRPLSSQ